MMEAGWSASRVSHQLHHSDFVISRRKEHHTVRNACIRHTVSFAAIQALVAQSLGGPVSSPTIQRCLALRSRHPLHELPLTPTLQLLRLEWCHVQGNWTAAEWDQVVFSDESRFNLSSDDNRVPVLRFHGERLNPVYALQPHTTSHSWCNGMRCHCQQYTVTPSIDLWHYDCPAVYP
ncbi:transposable element Tcb2 transposase [Trichonephila clavipes]|nr:transposable element Tcb2 transposase [Trichonephila clavipes]